MRGLDESGRDGLGSEDQGLGCWCSPGGAYEGLSGYSEHSRRAGANEESV